MQAVSFYFSFPSSYNEDKALEVLVQSSTQPCSTDIENDCILGNMYSNWDIGRAYCMYQERCTHTASYCLATANGCNTGRDCRFVEKRGIDCKGYAGEGQCGCTLGYDPVKTRLCEFICFKPPADKYCHPGSISVIYVSGRRDQPINSQYYVFQAVYNISTFSTLADVQLLESNLSINSTGLTSDQIIENNKQLAILKDNLCNETNLFTAPCDSYCKVSQISGQLPTSNCSDDWLKFCAYADNIASEPCSKFCASDPYNNSNCKSIYLNYCNNAQNFTKSVCRDFYNTQYINSQLSDPVMTILKTNCAQYADQDGNVIDKNGQLVTPGSVSDNYPVNTCACFLPNNVYNTFYDKITAKNPEFRPFFSINQCSYPDCANGYALQPQKLTCPNVAITSCIVNNTVGGNVTNSNFNIVNNCLTEVQSTGSFTNNNTNSTPEPSTKEYVTPVIPQSTTTSEPTFLQSIGQTNTFFYTLIAVASVSIVIFITFFYQDSSTQRTFILVFSSVIVFVVVLVLFFYRSSIMI